MIISVIIATFNRAAFLDECLDHVGRLRFADGDEVIVVDNGSTDATADVIEAHRSRFPVPLVHLEEHTPGKSHALMLALSVAAGDVLAFTDDDVNVSPTWLDAVRRTLRDPGIALMGGRVMPRWEAAPPAWLRLTGETFGRLTSPLALLNYGRKPEPLGDRTVLGANMAVRRDAIVRAGGFVTHLGKVRGTLLSGEDAELCRRVQAAGLGAIYAPDATVDHWVPADRMRLGYFLSWFFWSGITNAALDGTGEPHAFRGRSLFGVPLHLFKRLVASAAISAGALAVGRPDAAVERLVDVAFVAGYAAHCWSLTRLTPPARPAGQGA